MTTTMSDLVLVRSDRGDGGWSLHAPRSTDEEIAHGKAPPILTGPEGDRPNDSDYARAWILHRMSLDCDTSHESAKEWYRNFGYHFESESEKTAEVVELVKFEMLDDLNDDEVAKLVDVSGSKGLSLDEEIKAVRIAREIRAAAVEVETCLDKAVNAWVRKDVDEFVEAMHAARSTELGHGGDTPATDSLEEQLLGMDSVEVLKLIKPESP